MYMILRNAEVWEGRNSIPLQKVNLRPRYMFHKVNQSFESFWQTTPFRFSVFVLPNPLALLKKQMSSLSTAVIEMELFAAKATLRTSIKNGLKQLKCRDRSIQSLEITRKVLVHPMYLSSQGVAVFLSMRDEVDTASIVQHIFASGKHCYIPRYRETDGHMTMIKIKSYDELQTLPKTRWNIPQPLEKDNEEDALQLGGLDLILTPGLAFTKQGHRLGRGKGFYDKFIIAYNSLHKPPYLIGLALSPSLVDSIPCTLTDVKMDEVLYSNSETSV